MLIGSTSVLTVYCIQMLYYSNTTLAIMVSAAEAKDSMCHFVLTSYGCRIELNLAFTDMSFGEFINFFLNCTNVGISIVMP